MITPAAVISNMPKAAMPPVWATPSTRRLVEVPISVVVPPKIAAKETGIRKRDGATPSDRASPMATGITTTTMGVLLMKALIPITPAISAIRAVAGWAPFDRRDTSLAAASMTPVRSSAADSTKSAATVIGAALENTDNVSLALRMPVSSNRPMATSAMMSGDRTSRADPKNTAPTRASTNTICNVSRVNQSGMPVPGISLVRKSPTLYERQARARALLHQRS